MKKGLSMSSGGHCDTNHPVNIDEIYHLIMIDYKRNYIQHVCVCVFVCLRLFEAS